MALKQGMELKEQGNSLSHAIVAELILLILEIIGLCYTDRGIFLISFIFVHILNAYKYMDMYRYSKETFSVNDCIC